MIIKSSALAELVQIYRRPLIAAAALSAIVNILMLTGSLFMLQVYDRVLTSGSVPTLFVLLAIVLMMYVFLGTFDTFRARIFSRLARASDATLRDRVFTTMFDPTPPAVRHGALRDLETVRTFIGSPAPATFFDLPWIGIYLIILGLLHWVYGLVTIIGMILLLGLTLLTQRRTARPVKQAAVSVSLRQRISADIIDNAETLQAMGMKDALRTRWTAAHEQVLDSSQESQDAAEVIGSISKALRMFFQSVILAVGALLVLDGQATAGVIVAASIISARALSPIEQTVAHWRTFTAARQSWGRLAPLLERPLVQRTTLPPPNSNLEVKDLVVAIPGAREPYVRGVSFSLNAGEALGVIGPSGSGKTTLARALAGLWPVAYGAIRLDSATLDQWDSDARGKWCGYLPHDVAIMDGTPVQNITRFSPDRDDEGAYQAAKKAGALDMILRLPKGFDTPLGEGASSLSAGQRQRLGLARALYNDPFLVILDEPNANLDAEGEADLVQAIRDIKARGGIAIVMAHRPSAIAEVDRLLVMREGRVAGYGPRDEVLRRMTVAPGRNITPVSPVPATAAPRPA